MKTRLFIAICLMMFSLAPCLMPTQSDYSALIPSIRSAYGDENWRREFEEVCGNTEDSMKLPVDDLQQLIARCDRLKPVIESLEETPRKVYLKRLQMCRNLLAFVLETKTKK